MNDSFELVQVAVPGGATVIRVQGHLNARSTPGLMERCQVLKGEGQNLVLNLSGVSFIASSGIGGILALVEEFRDAGLSLRFAELSPAVESVIQLLNLESFLEIDGSESQAVAGIRR